MRWAFGVVTCGVAMGAGCGSVEHHDPADAGVAIDAHVIDAPPDAPACEKTLLVGGMDPTAQGWTASMIQPATISLGADYTELTTSTPTGASSGGQLLLTRAGTFAADEAFKLEVVMQVVTVKAHNQLDAAAAILGSLTGQFGDTSDRSEMIYLDAAKIGWADDTAGAAGSTAVNTADYHTYVLSVDAARHATLSVDGVATTVARNNYVTSGTIAVGDQTNDAGYDATTRIRSVRQRCAD